MRELNPEHPVTQMVHDQWHTLCALVMHKLKTMHVVISPADVERFSAERAGGCIVVQELADGLHLRFVDEATAEKLAKAEGRGN